MLKIEQSITIDRPIEEVFRFVADLENAPRFDPVMVEMKKTSVGPLGVGTTYRECTKAMGRQVEFTFTVITYEPCMKVAFQGSPTPFGEPRETYRLLPSSGGTLLTSTLELPLRGVMKLTEPLAAFLLKRLSKTRMSNLKQLLEA